ncbi:PD40 domain-containing protein [Candidatus Parcubacteria bacterium]|nr:PD40 domain-containing protein [Candidatus Parcubacteria bacterium]
MLDQIQNQNENQEKPKNFWQRLKKWQKIVIFVFVVLIVSLGVYLNAHYAEKRLLKKEMLKLSEDGNWKIFIGTSYSKTPFFLDFNGKYNAIFSDKNQNNRLIYSSLSPNGKKVAFRETVKANGDFQDYLTMADIDGENKERLIKIGTDGSGQVINIIWSPVAEQEIIFLSDYNSNKESHSLYLLNIKNKSKRIIAKNLISGLTAPSISWSPDGEKILFTSTEGRIMSINKDGSNLRQICDDNGFVSSWSPDNKNIAYKQGKSYVKNFSDGSLEYGYTGSGDYYMFDINSGSKKTIFKNKNIYARPAWSPDSKYILLHKSYDLGFKSDFWIIDVESGMIIHRFKSELKPNFVSWVQLTNQDGNIHYNQEEVVLTTDKTEYQTGEEVKLTIENNLDEEITFGIISLEMETDKWEEALSEENEIIIDNVFDEFVKDIYCDCNAECKKLPLSIKLNSSEEYIWDQKIGLCSELPLNKKLRFKIKSWNSGYINYSNEFIIKGDSAEIRGFDYCQEDSDCEVRFSHCDCRYHCVNKNVLIEDCAKECPLGGELIIPECICENNKCIDKNSLSEDAIQFLIQQMGDDNISQEIKNAIPEKLYDYGKEAIPYLIEALDDERVFDSCYEFPSGYLGQDCVILLVKHKCSSIINWIITPSPSLGYKYSYSYKVDDWQQWWNKNQDKSLNEIRKMVRNYYRDKEEENNYSAAGYRGEEYDYLDIAGDLTHDETIQEVYENCLGFDNFKQCDYLEWPISCSCLTVHRGDCYGCFAEKNKDASICDKITWNAGARDNCYWAVAIELNKAGMNDKIDFCGKIEDVGIENHDRQKACFEMAE